MLHEVDENNLPALNPCSLYFSCYAATCHFSPFCMLWSRVQYLLCHMLFYDYVSCFFSYLIAHLVPQLYVIGLLLFRCVALEPTPFSRKGRRSVLLLS